MRSLKPGMMTWLWFKKVTSNLVNMVIQSSLQSFPMEIRKPAVMSLKTWVDCALGESLLDIFKVARKSGLTPLPLAIWTVGPDVVRTMWEQCGRVSG